MEKVISISGERTCVVQVEIAVGVCVCEKLCIFVILNYKKYENKTVS